MGKPTGFLEYSRELPTRRPIKQRVHDWQEVYNNFPVEAIRTQGARCMDCGIPFCHQGCPLGNVIPDWNDLVYRDLWREAIDRLHATNNFPEFTGRLCPAPCEASCVLGINADPVTIKQLELSIVERAWEEGWIRPEPPKVKTGKKVAVIGSGPAGMACSQQLARAGHSVTLFERSDQIGGLMRYGIPEFKMQKEIVDRRIRQMQEEGVEFETGVNIGVNRDAQELKAQFDAIVLSGGSTTARDLPIPGRQFKGIYQAMEFLPLSNRHALDVPLPDGTEMIWAEGKQVIIIGGGDTGADCLGTVHRHGCRSVHQFEIVPRPPDDRSGDNPWPQWSNVFRTSSAHEEGGVREYAINTKEFLSDDEGNVRALRTVRVKPGFKDGRPIFEDIPDSEQIYEAELVLLAMGFVGPEKGGMLEQLGVEIGRNGPFEVVKSDRNRMTSVPGIFTAGDMARGQSLIVWAIAEGRHTAHGVDRYLMGYSDLPRPLDFGNDLRPFV